MGRSDEQARDEILLARLHPRAALAAASLRPIGGERNAFDIAEMRNGHHHVLAVDQVFFLNLAFLVEDHRAARRGEFLPHGLELVLDDGLDARARAQDVEIVGDLSRELVELGLDLVAAERGEALEPQVENGLGLLGGEPRRCRPAVTLWRGSSISVDERRGGGAPASRGSSALRAPRWRPSRRGSA